MPKSRGKGAKAPAPQPKKLLLVKGKIADVVALQDICRGTATADQQMRGIKYIVEKLSGFYDISFRPGSDGARDTDFHEGRRFVGHEIVTLTVLAISQMIEDEPK